MSKQDQGKGMEPLRLSMDALWRKEGAMLVLSRKKNESIMIGDSITITVAEIRGDKVRLKIEAPRDVSIHRWEVAIKGGSTPDDQGGQ